MAAVAGKPILEWQIQALRENGVTQIVLVVGYLGQVIRDYFGDGSRFGVEVTYFEEKEPLGTAGALPLLDYLEEDILLIFGDVIFDVDLERMERFHRAHGAQITLFVHPNTHPFDSDLIVTEMGGRVTGFISKNSVRDFWHDNCVNAGIYILSRELCGRIPIDVGKVDLERDVIAPLTRDGGAVYAYSSPEYVKDVGTPERIAEAVGDLKRGLPAVRCLKHPQKCIFLDRDGTINRYRGLISAEEDFELEFCAVQAVRAINKSGYLAIVVTNQPVVARGMCSIEDVMRIHNKMKTLLGREGAYLDEVLFCPHHPDKGYPDENPAYKISCRCRKPQTELIDGCVKKYNIDLRRSWMVGDTTTDIQTGRNAGLHTALVLTGEAGKDRKYPVKPEITAEDLLRAVKQITERDL